MSYVPLIRVFLSSPGDVAEERAIARKIMKRLPNRPSFKERVVLNIVAWDDLDSSTAMEASLSPQLAINEGLPTPAECEIVIVLFWSRMGTPFTDVDEKRYESGTHWELLNALSSAKTQSYIYRRTKSPSISMDDANFDERFKQYQRVKEFFNSELFFKNGEIKKSVHHYENPADFEELFDRHFEEIINRVLASIEAKEPASSVILQEKPEIEVIKTIRWPDGQSPFPGLRAFQEADADIFFGRGHETDALVRQLRDSRFVAVVGASGSGKSSLVGAGLIPRLRANAITGSKDWKIAHFTPNDAPFVNLAEALIHILPRLKLGELLKAKEEIVPMIESALAGQADWAEVLLFIDQFEELFTLSSKADAEAFTRLLESLSKSQKLRAVVTMRADFYHRAVDYPQLAELLRAGSFPLAIPKRDALRQMIERPAERAALSLDPALIDRILDDTGDEPGNLALMAYALDELYQIAEKRGDRRINFADYQALGAVHGAIGVRAHNIFEALAEEEKKAFLASFRHLISIAPDGTPTRKRALLELFEVDELLKKVTNEFINARLLVVEANILTNEAMIEVAHEALFKVWQHLSVWIRHAQGDIQVIQEMQRAAKVWEMNRYSDAYRWSHERLKDVYRALTMQGVDIKTELTKTEIKFLEPEQERLYRELEILETSHERRSEIGVRLALIGDTRQGVGLKDGLPDIAWLPVKEAGKIEIDGEVFEVKPFYISKYLVTYVQYQAFVEAENGYHNPQWWQKFLKNYRPQKLGNQRTKVVNNPRDTVSWYQSMAFAAWMNARFQGFAVDEGLIVGKTAEIRLPTEWEWQWVAQNGKEAREYPWGTWREAYANTGEVGLSRTTAVGSYPQGAAACGAMDMAGNLWEWCLNDYSKPGIGDFYRNENTKVLRGGAFPNPSTSAFAFFRYTYYPAYINPDFGLRLVLAPIASS